LAFLVVARRALELGDRHGAFALLADVDEDVLLGHRDDLDPGDLLAGELLAQGRLLGQQGFHRLALSGDDVAFSALICFNGVHSTLLVELGARPSRAEHELSPWGSSGTWGNDAAHPTPP